MSSFPAGSLVQDAVHAAAPEGRSSERDAAAAGDGAVWVPAGAGLCLVFHRGVWGKLPVDGGSWFSRGGAAEGV